MTSFMSRLIEQPIMLPSTSTGGEANGYQKRRKVLQSKNVADTYRPQNSGNSSFCELV